MPVRVSVVVPTYMRPERILPLLEALDRQTLEPSDFEVLVVDNASPDNSSAIVESQIDRVSYTLRCLRTDLNDGPASARNLGWRKANAAILAFADDDCTPEPEWLQRGLEAMERRPWVGVLQGRTISPRQVTPGEAVDHYVWRGIESATPYFEACNIFYRREAFESTGGFDEELGFWGEDTVAGWKVVEAGWDRSFEREAVVVHPIERRGLRWFVETGLLDTNIVAVAKRHRGFREEAFWRPWAYRREDATFVLALAGLAAGWRWRPALAAVVPYLWWRRPSVRRPGFFRLCVEYPLIDAARLAGQVRGAIRHRLVVL